MDKKDAISYFGSKTKLATALKITKQAVRQWKQIPIGRQYQIEVLTNGALQADRDQQDSAA